ncbi:MAG: hypothetical protein Q9187_003604 [Circinaria calcarea]
MGATLFGFTSIADLIEGEDQEHGGKISVPMEQAAELIGDSNSRGCQSTSGQSFQLTPTNEKITDPELQKEMMENRTILGFSNPRGLKEPPFKYVRLPDINPFAKDSDRCRVNAFKWKSWKEFREMR